MVQATGHPISPFPETPSNRIQPFLQNKVHLYKKNGPEKKEIPLIRTAFLQLKDES